MSDYGKLREQLAAKDKEIADLRKAYDALAAKVNELEKRPIEILKQDVDKLEAEVKAKAKGWFK